MKNNVIIQRIVNILRYVFAIPAGYIISRLLIVVLTIGANFYWGGTNELAVIIFDDICCTALFIASVHTIAPSKKVLFSVIASVIYGILLIVIAMVLLLYSNSSNDILKIIINAILVLVTLVVVNIKIIREGE